MAPSQSIAQVQAQLLQKQQELKAALAAQAAPGRAPVTIPPSFVFASNTIVTVTPAGAGVNVRTAAHAGGASRGALRAGERLQILSPPQFSASDGHVFYQARVLSSGVIGFVAAGENGISWLK